MFFLVLSIYRIEEWFVRKDGFTLIEFLGVLTILALLGVIIVPTINDIILNNKQKLYDTQIRNIKSGASNFMSDNVFNYDFSINESFGIKLSDLKNLGYIDSDIKNPISREKFSDDLVIIISNTSSGYTYTVCTENVYCDTNINFYGE